MELVMSSLQYLLRLSSNSYHNYVEINMLLMKFVDIGTSENVYLSMHLYITEFT